MERWEGHLSSVQFLLQQGADIHAENDEAIRYSAEQPKVLAWLLSYQYALEEKIHLTNHLTTQDVDSSP